MSRSARRDPYKLVGTTLGKYHILELVGVGGMGAVYRARHAMVQNHVALKILKPDLAFADPAVLQLFFDEAVKSGRLDHPNIIRVTDAEMSEDEIAYLTMEWLDGRTLDEELQRAGPFRVERVAALLEQLCDAVDYAHRQGIIHRDLKPSNIMLCTDHLGRETVKLLDFGIAKALASTVALNSRVMGAPYYASPEQLTLSAPIDQRSDIYSLGVTVYQLLTGELPFNADSIEKVMQQHLTVSPPKMRIQRPELAPEVDDVIQRALAKRPEERYQVAPELARAFRSAANVEPGSLVLRCTDEEERPLSGAAFYLDGEYVGCTDTDGNWRRDDLSPRAYRVEAVCPGYVSVQEPAVVEPRGEVTLSLRLSESAFGELRIKTGVPKTQVLLNGTAVGTTDETGGLHLRDLEPGEVEIEARCRKYQSVVRRVSVAKRQTTAVELQLERAPFHESLEAWPAALLRWSPARAIALASILLVAVVVVLLLLLKPRDVDDSEKLAPAHTPPAPSPVVASPPAPSPPVTSPSPEREVTFWFVKQPMSDGQLVGDPKIISPEAGVANGWKLTVYFKGQERGFLYLINDGPSAQGRSLELLFPIPNDPSRKWSRNNGTSEIAPGETVEIFENIVKGVAGTEHLWIVWSLERIPKLESLTRYANPQHKGVVNDQSEAEAVHMFLSNLTQADLEYNEQGQAVLRAEKDVLVKEILFRHE